MERSIAKGLGDKLYEKRKSTALDLQKLVTQCVADGDYARIDKIIGELCRDYTYALHQPMARNAGLMGLAASAIALGSNNVGKYLSDILPPVLACFGDQNDQVRFYACESLYNIAKIAKGEILVFFNEIFDVLCKMSADSESSVKGAAELLDRLVKDIVSERANNYISVINNKQEDLEPATTLDLASGNVYQKQYEQNETLAFSLPKFIPLLSERIYTINPDTRMFLVNWLKVLLDIPELELITFLPSFLGGLFTFLGDTHIDVRTSTTSLLNSLLHEIERTVKLQEHLKPRDTSSVQVSENNEQVKASNGLLIAEKKKTLMDSYAKLSLDSKENSSNANIPQILEKQEDVAEPLNIDSEAPLVNSSLRDGEEYILGQDIKLDFPNIIEILINNLASSEFDIQLVSLRWIATFLELCPNEFIPQLSNILSLLLKLLSNSDNNISEAAQLVNTKFIDLCANYDHDKNPSVITYSSIVNSLTLQFFDSKVDTKIACLDWLTLIYQRAPNQILEQNDSMILIFLKSLSDNDTRLIDNSLGLLNSLCIDPKTNYLKRFLTDLLTLLKNDSKLFKSRANYIMRQICARLSAERIYKVISQILDSSDDILFSRTMIQILSTNLVTASEMASLRKKLRLGEDTLFFNTLFKWWCHNPVSVISLCLMAEKHELAYSVLQEFVEYDLSLNDLIQLDVLVQLLESPVFTRLRLQLLEQQTYPYLYKCLYGILMILPQSKAFEILNRRLGSLPMWVSQYKGIGNPMIAKRNTSQSSVASDSTQRSVSQSRHHAQELLNHFSKVCEKERCIEAIEDDCIIDNSYFDTSHQDLDPQKVNIHYSDDSSQKVRETVLKTADTDTPGNAKEETFFQNK